MKSIANQYRDLKEGKMSQSNFMRNLRMSMPQYITNVTSFNDAIKILRNKAILTEADINELSPQTKYNAAMKAVDKISAASGTSDSTYTKALRQGNKFAQQIDPILKKAVEDFGKSLGFDTRIEKSTTGAQYEPIVQIRMSKGSENSSIKVTITKDTDKIEGRVNLPDEAAERKLGNLIKQIQQKELDVELKKDDEEPEPEVGRGAGLMKQLGINLENSGELELNESDLSRDAELGGVEDDFKQLLAKGYSYYEALELIAQNTGMDPDELESMLPQDAVDTEEYEDDELEAIISRMGGEEEAEKAIKGGFGIYDPLEEANGEFPRGPETMAQAIIDEFGDELISLSGREREKMALSHAYEKILNSGHPKAKIIARNLVFGYADEDWPMEYISTLNDMLSKKEDDELSAMSSKMDDEPKVPEMPMFKGTRDALDDLSIREGKKKEPKKELHPNQIHPGELRMGIRVELEHTDDLDKAKKIALDHLAENPFYYTALKLSGIESPSAPKAKAPKDAPKKAKKKDATELVDKANQMVKVKDTKKKLKEVNLNEAGGEYTFNGTLTNDEKKELDKILGYKGSYELEVDEVDDHYETTIIHDFYNEKSLEHAVKQVTGRLPQKKQFGDTIGFGDVLQSKLEALVREVVAETFDGRDNLTDVTGETEI